MNSIMNQMPIIFKLLSNNIIVSSSISYGKTFDNNTTSDQNKQLLYNYFCPRSL